MDIRDSSILITGGAGFIGSHLAKRYVALGAKVSVLDNFSSGQLKNLDSIKHKIRIFKGDIRNKNTVLRASKGANIISHHAAQLEITKAIKNPIDDLRINAEGTINILEAARIHAIKKVLFASSACVYGQKNDTPSKESDSTDPNWAYGAGKLVAEKYCHIYSELYGIATISMRYAIIYGENEWYGRAMTIFLKRAITKKPLIVFGDGQQKRDFTNVIDVVDANIALTKANIQHDVFNVSTGIGTTITQLAKHIAHVLQTEILFDTLVLPGQTSTYIKRQRLPSELQNLILDSTKLQKSVKWKPQISLEKGLRMQIDWLKDNHKRWKKMSY